MKKKVLFIAIAAGLLMTSCASKKDLANCQTENKSLTEKLQEAREDLAGKNARIQALEDQQKGLQQALKAAEAKYAKLQESLDKSQTNASQNNISIEKLVDQINESNQYITLQGGAQGGRCAGAQGCGLYLSGRQHAL